MGVLLCREIDQATAATFAIRLAACGMSVKFSDCCELAVGHKSEELAADESYSNRSYVR